MAGFTNIRQALEGVMMHPMLRDLTLQQGIFYASRFMDIVGSDKVLNEKTAVIHVTDYKGELPCDFHKIKAVREIKSNIKLRGTTDSFHVSKDHRGDRTMTYKIQGKAIITSQSLMDIEIVYFAKPVDCDGFILIPDDELFLAALEAYIKKEYFAILYDQNKLQFNQIEKAGRDYSWAVARYMASVNTPTEDEMESIANANSTLFNNSDSFATGFRTLGEREHLRQH